MTLLVVFPAGKAAATQDEAAAQALVRNLGDEAIELLRETSASSAGTVAGVRDLFRTSFDVPTIGQFALGRHWRTATDAQRQEYLALFEDMVVETYARRFEGYDNQTFVVDGSRPEGERDVMVRSRILDPNGPPVEVNWRVRDRGAGNLQIIDVMVEGVSMAVTQRNEFSSIIQRNGGNIDALLQAIRDQIASLRAGG
ncbi:MAG: ABC transporter substrate-binding protein [Rhodospirillaceae bacterium]|nr:ABC transporter substrate-binding protein [Rhodospirillaceae bacterium]